VKAKIYLSIDIDYWNLAETALEAKDFFRKIFRLGVPLVIVWDHQDLIEFADKSAATKVINVDYHSDYANLTEKQFEELVPDCGTWVEYIKRLKEFEWRYPSFSRCFKNMEGRCEEWTRFGVNAAMRFWKAGVSRRGHVVAHKQGIKNLPYSQIVAVGVAVSFGYWNNDKIENDIYKYLYHHRKHFKYIDRWVTSDWEDLFADKKGKG